MFLSLRTLTWRPRLLAVRFGQLREVQRVAPSPQPQQFSLVHFLGPLCPGGGEKPRGEATCKIRRGSGFAACGLPRVRLGGPGYCWSGTPALPTCMWSISGTLGALAALSEQMAVTESLKNTHPLPSGRGAPLHASVTEVFLAVTEGPFGGCSSSILTSNAGYLRGLGSRITHITRITRISMFFVI